MSENAANDDRQQRLEEIERVTGVVYEGAPEPPDETDDETWHLPPDEYEENGI